MINGSEISLSGPHPRTGHGKVLDENGTSFEGDFVDGLQQGPGVWISTVGSLNNISDSTKAQVIAGMSADILTDGKAHATEQVSNNLQSQENLNQQQLNSSGSTTNARSNNADSRQGNSGGSSAQVAQNSISQSSNKYSSGTTAQQCSISQYTRVSKSDKRPFGNDISDDDACKQLTDIEKVGTLNAKTCEKDALPIFVNVVSCSCAQVNGNFNHPKPSKACQINYQLDMPVLSYGKGNATGVSR
jgi:hypothetical protein